MAAGSAGGGSGGSDAGVDPVDHHYPWAATDGWRLGDAAWRKVELEHGGQRRSVELRQRGEGWEIDLDGRHDSASLLGSYGQRWASLAGRQYPLRQYRDGQRLHLFGLDGGRPFLLHDAIAEADQPPVEHGDLSAPMPGRVVALPVTPGSRVVRGQPLVVLEAMKMEHSLNAPSDGVLRAYRVRNGSLVAEGEALVDFEGS